MNRWEIEYSKLLFTIFSQLNLFKLTDEIFSVTLKISTK